MGGDAGISSDSNVSWLRWERCAHQLRRDGSSARAQLSASSRRRSSGSSGGGDLVTASGSGFWSGKLAVASSLLQPTEANSGTGESNGCNPTVIKYGGPKTTPYFSDHLIHSYRLKNWTVRLTCVVSYISDGKFAFLKAGKSAVIDIVSDWAVFSLVSITCLAVVM